METLRFRKGCKNWDTTYEVSLISEYTPDLEKKITHAALFRPETNQNIRIPWGVLEGYLNGEKTPLAGKDLSIKPTAAGLYLMRNGSGFTMHKDQMRAVLSMAEKTPMESPQQIKNQPSE